MSEKKEVEEEVKFDIIQEFQESLTSNPGLSLATAAISCLLAVVERSSAQTIQGLIKEIEDHIRLLIQSSKNNTGKYASSISLISGCELFIRSVTRLSHKQMEYSKFLKGFLERAKRIHQLSMESKNRIATYFEPFIQYDMKILLIGYSTVALNAILKYKQKHFEVVVPEGRPDGSGYMSANRLQEAGIPCTIVTDSTIAHIIDKVDFVLCGAEGVVENGGIINKIGTYQIALIAHIHKKPFYVAVESFKFVRIFPLSQKDVSDIERTKFMEYKQIPAMEKLNKNVKIESPVSDFTPPKYITLLVTDLGVLTPSGISDELIKLYT